MDALSLPDGHGLCVERRARSGRSPFERWVRSVLLVLRRHIGAWLLWPPRVRARHIPLCNRVLCVAHVERAPSSTGRDLTTSCWDPGGTLSSHLRGAGAVRLGIFQWKYVPMAIALEVLSLIFLMVREREVGLALPPSSQTTTLEQTGSLAREGVERQGATGLHSWVERSSVRTDLLWPYSARRVPGSKDIR